MKYIIIGLGNFGSVLCDRLSSAGHEVIAVDNNPQKVEEFKDLSTSSVCLDSTEEHALKTLPLSDVDVVIVTIGENVGASILTMALLKKLQVKHIIGRSLSPIHQTIIEALGVEDIINPEKEAALHMASRLEITGTVDQFTISDNLFVVELKVPTFLIQQQVGEIGFDTNFNLKLLTIKRMVITKNMLGQPRKEFSPLETITDQTELMGTDHLVLYGKAEHFQKLFRLNLY